MRSISFTLLLALVAAAVCGLIGWRVREGNLDALFGVPPIATGDRVYKNFQVNDVGRITVSSHGIREVFENSEHGWRSVAPPHDRMDPRYAAGIVLFSLNLRVVDSADTADIDRDEAGLRDDGVQISLETSSGANLARYRIGRRTPFMVDNKESTEPDPTVYIQPRERDLRDHVYACTGDIAYVFRDNLKFLRDHRPFFIDPNYVRKIRIRGTQGEMTLDHPEPGERAPWRITKPLDLSIDRTAMLALLNGLKELAASKISDRGTVTLPGAETGARSLQIGVTPFGTEEEVVLEVYPPESADATETLATVSDRPDTVFHLPLKAGPGSLANLPGNLNRLPVNELPVDDLRNRSLLSIDLTSLRTIDLIPITGQPIHITGEPKKSWQVEINGKSAEANELRLLTLLESLTAAKAIRFESDAATDFTPWGLDKPVLVISVAGETGPPIRIRFGLDRRGGLFANREGTATVMNLDEKILSAIPIQAYEWRHARLWSVSVSDLTSIDREVKGSPPLHLDYDNFNEKWSGHVGDNDVTDRIDTIKAKYMLESIVGPNVSRWLAVGNPEAAAALADPVFTLTVTENKVDDFGDKIGETRRTLTLAPVPGDSSYYGRMSEEPHPFIIDRATASKIGTDPLEGNP